MAPVTLRLRREAPPAVVTLRGDQLGEAAPKKSSSSSGEPAMQASLKKQKMQTQRRTPPCFTRNQPYCWLHAEVGAAPP